MGFLKTASLFFLFVAIFDKTIGMSFGSVGCNDSRKIILRRIFLQSNEKNFHFQNTHNAEKMSFLIK